MKKSFNTVPFIALTLSFVCLAGWKLVHAQDTDTNIDWNSLSDSDVELKAVEAMPTISASQFEASGLEGTFYSAQHINDWPPLPGNWLSLPIWEVDTNLFLINDLDYDYAAAQAKAAKISGGIHALDDGDGGFSPDFSIPTNGLFLQITGVSNGYANLILNGTTNGVEYEILSQPALGDGTNIADWNSEGLFWGSESTNWTATTVAQNDRTNLFFSARSWQDSTGTGIPNWWWLTYFGQDTNVDAYADPDQDGWNNLQEFQNGTSPTAFDTPPAPQGLAVSFDSASSTADVSWQPSPSPVTGYTVNSYDEWTGQTTNFNFSASADSFSDAISDSSDEKTIFGSDSGPTIAVEYQIQAHYPGGDSAWSDPVLLEPNYTSPYNLQATLPVSLIAGPQGSAYLAASGLPAGTVTLRVKLVDEYAETFYGDASFDTTVDIPISALTNGLYLLPTALTAPPTDSYGQSEYVWYVQTVDAADNPSEPMPLNIVYSSRAVPSYFDGRTQLKQNLTFLLRAPNATAPFQFVELYTNEDYSIITTSSNYVYAGLGDAFANNYLYRNFVFSTTNVDSDGAMTTGVSMYDYDGYPFDEDEGVLLLLEPWSYQFQQPSTNDVTIASLLATDQTRWLCAAPLSLLGGGGSSEIGFSSTTDTPPIWTLSGSAKNYWGLPYLSAELAYGSGGSLATTTLSAGNSIQLDGANVYMEAAQPQFQMVEYDFWSGSSVYGSWSGSPLPGMANFSTSQTSDFLITAVGNPNFQVASYAKLAVTNAYSGVYAYLGQYFTNAYEITNGVVTTNSAGILSSYGFFFPTNPGPAALVTMPDPDTGARGTCTVYAVSLQLDANHDGIMDTAFSGADTTSQANPMECWVNNGYILPGSGGNLDQDEEVFNNTSPNYSFGQITCPRDLENFFRLWICGIPSLPASQGYTVTLSCSAISGSPAINLYAAEDDGGIGYLTDTNIAQSLVGYDTFGTISPTNYYLFPANFFDGTNKYFMFEGAGIGEGQFTLTIYQSGNVIAQTSTYIDLHDIKDFYEQAVITNNMSGAISNWSSSLETVQQPASSALDEDTNIIVFVHGINVDDWHWLDDSDTVFKRLYWADYQGKFATMDWPCNLINYLTFLTLDVDDFNDSEVKAYKASTALTDYLSQLRMRFPSDRLNLFAHSQGNAVVSEAIEQGAPFDTYILTQGALPASCYDVNAATNSTLLGRESYYPTPDGKPMGYHGVYTNLTGKIVDFFNSQDKVLGYWFDAQEYFKPSIGYSYDGTNSYYTGTFSSYTVTDPQESRADVSRSRTLSIGQQEAQGVIQSTVDLNAQFGFNGTTTDEHSAQWTRPIQTSLPYYVQIINSINP